MQYRTTATKEITFARDERHWLAPPLMIDYTERRETLGCTTCIIQFA